jgi:hypothetical protein
MTSTNFASSFGSAVDFNSLAYRTAPAFRRAVFYGATNMESGRMTPRYLESDSDWQSLIDYLRRETPLRQLNGIEGHAIFRELRQLGYRIEKPSVHPSGLETTEEAITTVVAPGHYAKIHADANGKRFRK